jgi:hypothetical protein
MIDPNNGSKWGIKRSTTDITVDIHEIIDKAKRYVVVCGYNFSPYIHPTSIIPRLIVKRHAGVNILVIAPPRLWGFGNRHHLATIQYLLQNNIGVILNSNNHSKWLLSDHGYYYGSSNFTAISMTSKVEVASFCNVLTSTKTWWMLETKKELLNFAIFELNSFNTRVATLALGTLNIRELTMLRMIYNRILRFNPDFEKVLTTLNNYEYVRQDLSQIIDLYFPLVTLENLGNIWGDVSSAMQKLDRLAVTGNNILIQQTSERGIERYRSIYNRRHKSFSQEIADLIKLIQTLDNDNNVQIGLIELNRQMETLLKEESFDADRNGG